LVLQVEEEGLLEVQVARQREMRRQQSVSNRADGAVKHSGSTDKDKALSREEEESNAPRRHSPGPKRRRRAGRKRYSGAVFRHVAPDEPREFNLPNFESITMCQRSCLASPFIQRDLTDTYRNAEGRNVNCLETRTEKTTEAPPAKRRRVTRAATARKERVWDYGVIPYEIDGNFSGAHKALFKQAMRHWENHTCVKFVERSPSEHPNYILFTERPCGCCSFVGKRGNGPQAISIGKNCDKFGIVVHELGHVVGFWHEHTRPDRDDHVQIVRENIMTGQEYNFNKLTEEEVNSLNLPYDYDSIMHYARNTFSKGTYLDTILPLERYANKRRPEIGQRIRLSEGDIAQTNLLYKCFRCGRTYQENSGTFSSPSHPNSSPPVEGERCEWRITATHGERIVLNITELDVFSSDNCRSDYLEVRDGYWHKSPVLGRYCGSGRIHNPVISTGSRMLVTYITSTRQNGHRGFTANYEAVCGGHLEMGEGHLESPNYPEDYQANKECVWKLSVPQDYQVALKFESFEVENHDSCVYDYLEVRDGPSLESPLIGVYCGYKIPHDIRSTGSHLLVKFVSDGSVQKVGFSAKFMKEFDECALQTHGCEHHCINTLGGYECACRIGFELHSDGKHCEDACGGVFDASNGTLTSPSFPELYPGNKNCVWEIIAPPQYRITLNFTHFELEGNNANGLIVRHYPILAALTPDNLRVGLTMYKALIRSVITYAAPAWRFAAVSHLRKLQVIQNQVIRLITHLPRVASRRKFHDELELPTIDEFIARLARNLYAEVRANPNPLISGLGHFFVDTLYNAVDVLQQECEYDSVQVHSKMADDVIKKHGVYCGSRLPPLITSEGNSLRVEFISDNSVQKSGFAAVFFTDMDECATNNGGCQHECRNTIGSYACSCHNGFMLHENGHDCKEGGCKYEITAPSGTISSPNYPDYYPSRKDCVWHFTTTPGHRIKLVSAMPQQNQHMFNEFELEPHQECAYDHIVLYDGDSPDAHTLGRFCGSKPPHPIIATGNQMFLVFKSDASVQRKGFFASHTTACGGHLQATDRVKHLYSHSKYGDHNYDNRADCDWSIEAPPGRNVHLTFLTFEVEDEQDCGYDFVEVYAGLDASGPSYGRFCGNSNPTDIISMNEALLVRFRSDDTIVNKGFSAAYVAVEPMGSEEVADRQALSEERQDD
ncbi:hypothetical protein ANN_25392, partial [Periplaneta americana]